MSSLHQGFKDIGESADIAATIRWLDSADANPLMREMKQQMLDACPVKAGDQVLDVGCGLGHEIRRLAERMGPHGRAVGIDANAALITQARRRAAELALPLSFEVSDAQQVALPDGTFDLCRTERVLRYVERPDLALGEMARLTRPGGSVLAFDFDSDSTVIDAPDPVLAGRVAAALDAAVPQPWIGRQLHRLFKQAGLREVRVIPTAFCVLGAAGFAMYSQLNGGTIDRARQAGQLTDGEVATWWQALEQAAEADTFLVSNTGFITVGHKP